MTNDNKDDVEAMEHEGPAKIGKFVVKGMKTLGGAPDAAADKAKDTADKLKKAPGKFAKALAKKMGV